MQFEQMLDRIYEQLNPTKTKKLVIPNIVLENSTTNTYWKNVKKILQTINCSPDHFMEFLKREAGEVNWMSASKSDGIVFLGKYKKKKITRLLQKYITSYIICNICKSSDTQLIKNKTLRCYQLHCNKCLSTYVV